MREELIQSANLIEESITFWINEFDILYSKVGQLTKQEDIDECQAQMDACLHRITMEQRLAVALEKKINFIISQEKPPED